MFVLMGELCVSLCVAGINVLIVGCVYDRGDLPTVQSS